MTFGFMLPTKTGQSSSGPWRFLLGLGDSHTVLSVICSPKNLGSEINVDFSAFRCFFSHRYDGFQLRCKSHLLLLLGEWELKPT